MGMVPPDRPLNSFPFLDNELIPVVPAGHPLLDTLSVSAEEFLGSQLLTREPGSGSRLALEVYCQQHRLKMEATMELGSNDAGEARGIGGSWSGGAAEAQCCFRVGAGLASRS